MFKVGESITEKDRTIILNSIKPINNKFILGDFIVKRFEIFITEEKIFKNKFRQFGYAYTYRYWTLGNLKSLFNQNNKNRLFTANVE